ncbi:MAG: RNA pseudouridine synthase [Oscillospiraceae bacterium]|jgi:23S rRNA pseudouridine955/2504/2580 synthase|nr:RNA pseudouridine synthase [Oscillospiraceae bacterium]
MLEFLFEDSNVVIVNKPQRLPVEPDGDAGRSLIGEVSAHCGVVYACHRLDTMTGGLVLLAKTVEARDAAFVLFRGGTEAGVSSSRGGVITKVYLCETICAPKPASGELIGYMTKDSAHSFARVYDRPAPGAKLARTLYSAVKRLEGGTCLVAARLLTGRTHQIRAQMSAAGWPILGDDKYGDRRVNRERRVRAQRLWAVGMVFGETGGYLAGLSGQAFWVRAPFAADYDTREIGLMRWGTVD